MFVHCGQTVGPIKTKLGTQVGLGPGAKLFKYSAHVYCGQTVGRMKLILDMKVGLNPGDFVLDGDSALPPQRGGANPPNFRPMFIAAKRLDR